MQCPRCTEEIADQSAECPVCRKPLSPRLTANMRLALTGDSYEAGAAPRRQAPVAPAVPPCDLANQHELAGETAEQPPLRLIPTKPGLFPTPRRAIAPPATRASWLEPRWLIVLFAVIGVIASSVLFHRPYVAPVNVVAQTAGQGEILLNAGGERPIPAVYLWLWASYGLLAIAVQLFLPAPWRFGARGMRTNWVLNITTVFTLLLFAGTNMGQQAEGILGREALTYQEGTYQYQNGNSARSVTAEEAAQINARMIQDRELAIFRQWNLAAILAFLAIAAYAAWWIIERPEAQPLTAPRDPNWLVRHALGQPEPSNDPLGETMPSENARARESAPGDKSWR